MIQSRKLCLVHGTAKDYDQRSLGLITCESSRASLLVNGHPARSSFMEPTTRSSTFKLKHHVEVDCAYLCFSFTPYSDSIKPATR